MIYICCYDKESIFEWILVLVKHAKRLTASLIGNIYVPPKNVKQLYFVDSGSGET